MGTKSAIRRIIRDIVNWADDSNTIYPVKSNHDEPDISDDGIRFTIHNASGGKVVSTFFYDRRKGIGKSGLYIITDADNFGQEIELILSRELLAR